MTGSLQKKNGKYHIVISYKDASGQWRTKWKSTNLEIRGNKKIAERMMAEMMAEYGGMSIQFDLDTPFVDLLDQWLEDNKFRLDTITYEGYKHSVENHIRPHFEPILLTTGNVTTDHIQRFYNKMLESGRLDGKGGLSPASIKQYHAVIRQVLEYAVDRKLLTTNPAAKVILPKKHRYQASFYNASDVYKMLEACDNEQLYPILLLTTMYGLRRSEVAGLKWQAVDFTNNTVCIQHTVVQNFSVVRKDKTKNTASHRTYPMVGEVRDCLLALKRQQESEKQFLGAAYGDTDYIFRWPDGHPIKPEWMSRTFSKMLKNLGMRHIRFYDLRHSCASILLANGYTLKDIQEWLGHADIKMTGDIYGHLEIGRKVKMGNHFGQIIASGAEEREPLRIAKTG